AVQAVADADGGFQRFDVDVRRADAEGFRKGLENQLDDGRVLAAGARLGVAGGDGELRLAARGGVQPVELLQVKIDVLGRGADEVELAANDVRQAVHRLEIQRIDDGDGQVKAVILDRDHPVAFGDLVGERLGDGRIEADIAEVDEGDAGVRR